MERLGRTRAKLKDLNKVVAEIIFRENDKVCNSLPIEMAMSCSSWQ